MESRKPAAAPGFKNVHDIADFRLNIDRHVANDLKSIRKP
jgi:hypothetical protein